LDKVIRNFHNVIEEYKNEKFLIQFNNIREDNYFLFERLKRFANVKLLTREINVKKFLHFIHETKSGVLTYDPYKFSLRPSGILEEYALANTPIIVPEGTGLHYFMKKFNLSGESYNPFSFDDFIEKFDKLVKKGVTNNGINNDLYNLNRVDKFISDIMKLYNTREFKTEIKIEPHLKGIVNEALKKGDVEYLTNVAELLIHNKREREAYNILENVIKKDERYIRAYYLLLKYFNYSKTIYYFNNYKSTNTYDPVTLNRISRELIKRGKEIKNVNYGEMIEPAFLEISELVDLAIEMKKKGYTSKKIFFLLDKLGIKIQRDLIKIDRNKFEKNIREIKSLMGEEDLFLIHYKIGNIIYKSGFRCFEYFLNKSLKLILYKREKSDRDYYYIGGIYEKLNNFLRAKEWFRKVLENTKDAKLESGAYFHLGVIEIKKGRDKKALNYFKKSVEISSEQNPLYLYNLASSYKKRGDYESAVKYFKKALTTSFDYELKSGVYFHLGEIDLWNNNVKKAKEYFEECLEINPNHRKAREYLISLPIKNSN